MNLIKQKSKPARRKAMIVLLALLAFNAILIPSCKKDLFELDRLRDPVWEPSLAIPLVNSTLTVPDVLDRFNDDEIIVVDSDGLLALKYFSNIFSIPAEFLFALPDQSTTVPYSLTLAEINDIENGSGSNTASQSQTVPFNTSGGEQLTEITFKGGTFDANYANNIPHDANITVTIPGLTLGGTTFTSTNFVAANNTISFSEPLAGYVFDVSNGGTTNDEFEIQLTITYTDAGGIATPVNRLDMDFAFNQMQFSLIRGDLGQPSISTDLDSVRVRIFENSTSGEIFWEDPKIRAIFTNSFGMGVEVGVATLASRSNLNPAITVTGTPFGEGSVLTINASPAIGSPIVNTFEMNRSTSNIQTVANSSPTKIIYDINASGNPGGGSPANFAADTSRLKLDMELELPFHGWARNFTQADTVRFDSLQFDDVEEIQAVTFRLNVDNGFPIDGQAQVYFLDSTDAIIDSLITDPAAGLINSGVVDPATFRVTERVKTITDIVLTRDQLDFLKSRDVFTSGGLVYIGTASTTNMGNTVIKIFQDYDMALRLGMKVDGKVNVPLDSLRQ